jgi:uncharacterized membrane protein
VGNTGALQKLFFQGGFEHTLAALFAGAVLLVLVKALKYGRKLRHYIREVEIFLIEFFTTVFAKPDKTVQFGLRALLLDYQTNSIGWSTR